MQAMNYHAMRSAHARRTLVAGLQRWGAYLLTALAVLAAGSQAPLTVAAALLGATALPLWNSALALATAGDAWAGASAALAWLGQVLLLALAAQWPLWASRRLWWPLHWAESERALPLSKAIQRRSDARLLPWFTAPVLLLVTAGWAGLLMNSQGPRPLAALLWSGLGLVLATAAAQALGWAAMQWTRRQARAAAVSAPGVAARAVVCTARQAVGPQAGVPQRGVSHGLPDPAARMPLRRRHWLWAWLWSPLLRGVARGSAWALLLSSLATPALAAGPLIDPALHGPGLAAMALVALSSTGWLRGRMRTEWAHLALAAQVWPVPALQRERALDALALWPAALGLCVAAVAMPWAGWRPAFGLIYLGLLGLGCWLQTRPPAGDASAHSARWLLLLIVAVAAAFESAPA